MAVPVAAITADDFKGFFDDMLEYTFFKHNSLIFKLCQRPEKKTKVFVERFSDAVLLYYKLNLPVFEESLLQREDGDDHLEYIVSHCDALFKGKYHHMKLIHYCALVFDLGFYFLFEDPDMVDLLIDNSYEIFEIYIQPYFSEYGGWDSLYREADDYVASGGQQATDESGLSN